MESEFCLHLLNLFLTIIVVVCLGDSNSLCPANKFHCMTKIGLRCLSHSWKCDGKTDCEDGYDEDQCTSCNPVLWACNSSSPTALHCLDKSWRCDGRTDCEDGSDEQDCETTTKSSYVIITAQLPPNGTKSTDSANTVSKSAAFIPMTTASRVADPRNSESELGTDVIVGIVFGGSVGIAIIIAGICFFVLKPDLCSKIENCLRSQEQPSPVSMMHQIHQDSEQKVPLQSPNIASATTSAQGRSTNQTGKRQSEFKDSDLRYPQPALDDDSYYDSANKEMLLNENRFTAVGSCGTVLISVHDLYIQSHIETEVKTVSSHKLPSESHNCKFEETRQSETDRESETDRAETTSVTFSQDEQLPRMYDLFHSREKLPTQTDGV